MPGQYSGSAVIDRPIEEVFAYLAAGTNDPRFSPRVLEIRKETEGPPAAGTAFVSKVKDAGMTTDRRFELTAVQEPTTIRWSERSRNLVTVTEGDTTSSESATRRPRSPCSTLSPAMASARCSSGSHAERPPRTPTPSPSGSRPRSRRVSFDRIGRRLLGFRAQQLQLIAEVLTRGTSRCNERNGLSDMR